MTARFWRRSAVTATTRAAVIVAGGLFMLYGKIEPGEAPEAALVREIHEELDADIKVGPKLITVDYDYPEFAMTMQCFVCTLASSMKLLEHSDARWLNRDELDDVGWLPSDIEVVAAIRDVGVV